MSFESAPSGENTAPRALPFSSIHPAPSPYASAVYMFSAPIDIEDALSRMLPLWGEMIEPVWEEVTLPSGVSGKLLHYRSGETVVMLTPASGQAVPEKGTLPHHNFYINITVFAPNDESESSFTSASARHTFSPSESDSSSNEAYIAGRKRAVAVHRHLTRTLDVLSRSEAAIGVFLPYAGIVRSAEAIMNDAAHLHEGILPFDGWVSVRGVQADTASGRTFGLPLFGHLDVEIMQQAVPWEICTEVLAILTEYIAGSDEFLFPGQTVTASAGGHDYEIAVAQGVSPIDEAPVLRLTF